MTKILKANLFDAIPNELSQEWFQTLLDSPDVKIERIVSKRHSSPAGFWYDQDWDEWVLLLKGSAGLRFQGQDEIVALMPGDWILIPSKVKHRVEWTDEQVETVWLAIHLYSGRTQRALKAPKVRGKNRRYGSRATPTNKRRAVHMDQRTYQHILNDAIQGEIEAHQFYQGIADKVEDHHLREMFRGFAGEELKHRRILERFRDKSDMALHFVQVPDFHISETMDAPMALSLKMKPADAIALAMKKEETAMRHYTQLADACSDPTQQKIFRELAAMERGHKTKMENAFVDIGFPEVW